MSLFKVCQWWSTQCSDISKSYDSYSLNCCRLHFDNMEKDCIVITSHNGYMGIYRPTSERLENGQITGFQHSDVVLEINFQLPVIGFCTGRFSHSNKDPKPLLAVLHPMKLIVYALVTSDGIADHGDQTKLHLVYEHILKKSAYSVCQGNFGGVKGREFLCVTHLDGSLKFFEQDGITYECRLPEDRHIPAPMVYVPRTDCFLTISPAWDLECYRYQDLIEIEREGVPIWSLCIGEWALDYDVHQISNTESAIVILGENNLFCVSDTGKVKFIKRLDYAAVCFCSFVVGWYWEPGSRLMIAIVSENGSLLIYNNCSLIWSAQFENIPICISRANVHNLPGAIITLGDEGLVNIGFLGTDPFLFKVPPLNLQDVDFEKTQQELIELEKEIQAGLDFEEMSLINKTAEKDLNIDITVGSNLETLAFPTTSIEKMSGGYEAEMCLVSVTVRSLINLEQLQICFYVEAPLKCSNMIYLFRDMVAEQPERLDTWVFMDDLLPVSNLWMQILFSFVTKQGIPRIIQRRIMLPINLVFKTSQPQKDAKFKITLTADSDQIDSGKLFPAIFNELSSVGGGGGHALGVQNLYTSSVVTIVAAKNSSRLRIQTDSLLELPLVLEFLIEKLQKSQNEMSKNTGKHLKLSTNPQLPTEEIMKSIDAYFSTWNDLNKLKTNYERKTTQFRLFERCSLKVKDKKAKDLEGIAELLEKCNMDLIGVKRNLVVANQDLQRCQIKLSCALNLCKQIVQHWPIPIKTLDTVLTAFVTPVSDWLEQSWAQALEPTIDQLTYSGPLRQNGHSSTVFDDDFTYQERKFDSRQFRRHFVAILEQTIHLATQQQQSSNSAKLSDIDDGLMHDDDGEVDNKNNGNTGSIEGNDAEQKQLSEWVNYEIPPTSHLINTNSATLL